MYFIKLDGTYGINLAHVVEWLDMPTTDEPFVRVWFSVPSENEHGQRQPHDTRLYGEQRERFLLAIDYVSTATFHALHTTPNPPPGR